MKPTKEYNGRSRIRMFNMDNRDFMNQVDDNYYDLAICDPEYGINVNHNMGRRKGDKPSDYKKADWDKSSVTKTQLNEVIRVSKNQVIWGANHFISQMPIDSSCWLIWDKKFSNDVTFASAELAWTSFNTTVKTYSKTSARVNGIHPTQKPPSLYRWILKNYAEPNQKIFDGWGGSMSIAIACWDLGFDLDIIELDEDYFNDAVKRFEQHISQTQLF